MSTTRAEFTLRKLISVLPYSWVPSRSVIHMHSAHLVPKPVVFNTGPSYYTLLQSTQLPITPLLAPSQAWINAHLCAVRLRMRTPRPSSAASTLPRCQLQGKALPHAGRAACSCISTAWCAPEPLMRLQRPGLPRRQAPLLWQPPAPDARAGPPTCSAGCAGCAACAETVQQDMHQHLEHASRHDVWVLYYVT